MQDQGLIVAHYKEVSSFYDEFYKPRYDVLASSIIREFDLKTNDTLVDFGGGTGAIAHLCWKKAGLHNNVLVVDPSKEMLGIASSLEGVTAVEGTCESFMQSDKRFLHCNMFMFCRSVHHLSNPVQFFTDFFNRIRIGDKLMIVEQPEDLLWASVSVLCRPFSIDLVESNLSKVGFAVSKTVHTKQFTCVKTEYFNGLRNRIYSILKYLSDEEIEEGLKELDKDHFHFQDSIEIKVKTIFLTATKQ